jgi:hypothetical protein
MTAATMERTKHGFSDAEEEGKGFPIAILDVTSAVGNSKYETERPSCSTLDFGRQSTLVQQNQHGWHYRTSI